ncbi:MAG: phosphatase PAP2 family protein [Candidatus Methanoperedens sp.]|nr:phosphatase PAP2 family protein [Candidatus Methanoperedens sp.]
MLEPLRFFFNENIITNLQGFGSPFLDKLFKAITTAGSEPAFIFLALLIFWCFSKKTGIRAMYVILFSAFAAILLKNLFSMPRPPEYLHKIEENGFGFPSGHAQVSSGFWGYLGCKIRNKWIIFVGTVAVLSISLSRVYLGVHYAGDVMGGIIFGLIVALIFFKVEPAVTNKLGKLNRSSKYFIVVALPVILVAIGYMQQSLLTDQLAIGLVMGSIGVGYLLEEEYVKLQDAENNAQRIRRAVVGIVVVGIIYLILSELLLINQNFIFFKYPALGIASTFLAPWIFKKIEAKNQKST